MICVIKQTPNSDPKFHQAEMFDGVGRSIRASLMVLNSGWFLRRLRAIEFLCRDIRMMRMDRAKEPR